jgi:hypothetical protein
MLKSIIFLVLLSTTANFLSAQINFFDAIAEGDITVNVKSLGGASGQCLSLTFEKTTKKPIKLLIPAGCIFEAKDSTSQDIITVENTIFTLTQPKQFLKINGYCAEARHNSPTKDEQFASGKKSAGALLKLAEYLQEKKLHRHESVQLAIWAVTDSFDVAAITHPGILAFTCQLLGTTLPAYRAKYEVRPNTPTQTRTPMVEPAPFAYEGSFEHQSNIACKVSIYMVNKHGEKVRTMFEQRDHLPGWAKYSFYFKTTKLSKGEYEIIFAVDEKPTKKIKISY